MPSTNSKLSISTWLWLLCIETSDKYTYMSLESRLIVQTCIYNDYQGLFSRQVTTQVPESLDCTKTAGGNNESTCGVHVKSGFSFSFLEGALGSLGEGSVIRKKDLWKETNKQTLFVFMSE